MATTKTTANSKALGSALSRMQVERHHTATHLPLGVFVLRYTVPLSTADIADENEVNVAVFPAGRPLYLYDLSVKLTDIDSGGSPSHVCDIMIGSTIAINQTTIGQGGGIDELDVNNSLKYADIQGLTVKLKTKTAAATAATGTLDVWLTIIGQMYSETGS